MHTTQSQPSEHRTHLPVILLACLLPVLAACDSTPTPTANPAPVPPATVTATAQPTQPTPATATRVQPTSTVPSTPSLPVLPAGWTRISPGGDTSCARDTPYMFWVHPGTVNKLLVYFEGGGGCWNAETCRPGSTFFEDDVTERDSPEYQGGVLDLSNPENPFKDYYAVFVPYCTGDVHMGNYMQTYTGDSGEQVTIHHKGFVNSSAAVNWAFDNVSSPESVFVTGCSAGSIGSIFFAPYVMKHYPGASIYQFGDSEAYVFDHPVDLQTDWHAHDNFPDWIPAMREILPGAFTIARYYSAVARFYPQHMFSQYNTAHDYVQQRFYFAASASPTPPPWEDALDESLAEIHAAAPNFRSYTAEGGEHCVTPRDKFYAEQVGGTRLRDWVDDLANGRPVDDVSP